MTYRQNHRAPSDTVRPGSPEPLGARCSTGPGGVPGTNFALWAGDAEAVEVCLFDEDGAETRHLLPGLTHGVRHGFLPHLGPGARYGFRVHGRWDPAAGERRNPAKLLLDPYARAVDGEFGAAPETFGHCHDPDRPQPDPDADLVRDERDSAPHVPKGVVVAEPGLLPDERPRTPWSETVLYELHVRGFTRRHPEIPAELRGSYAGLAHPAAVERLQRLGVTAVELLPVHQYAHEERLLRRGLRNHWGYSSIGFFAPHAAYASGGTRGQQVEEFRAMVRALHAAGIEVILDVVYNHTAEGSELGPTLSLRGIDNAAYYRLAEGEPRRYADTTGCGNTLDLTHPQTLRLVADSLRYWVEVMGADGFRFDLAPALTRTGADGEVDLRAPFLAVLAQDPVLRGVKLIAEPWDTGSGGYLVGAFPPPWAEWNDRYRDTVRDFWRGALPDVRDLGFRLTGSSDLYAPGGRGPCASVNFLTAHDGFTLRDLVSYERKHNEANGEAGRDGAEENRSWNSGAEGGTDDPDITALRARRMRALLATLLLSAGVPMLLAGDELGRTQGGNNNAYCQDNETAWVDWSLREEPAWRELEALVGRLVRLRRAHPVLRHTAFLSGQGDAAWFSAEGAPMAEEDWYRQSETLALLLSGRRLPEPGARDGAGADDSFLWVLHAGAAPLEFRLPGAPWAQEYELVVDSAREEQARAPGSRHRGGAALLLPARSVQLLRVAG